MSNLTIYHYVAMALGVLTLLFGTGWFIRKKRPFVEILNPLLIREHEDQCFGLKFEGRIINEGDAPTIAKKAEAFLYLSDGHSIKTNFSFGIRGIKDSEGHLFPQTLEPHTTYYIAGFESQPHNLWAENIREILNREDLTLRCRIKCSNLKEITIRCNKRGELKEKILKTMVTELVAKFNKIKI